MQITRHITSAVLGGMAMALALLVGVLSAADAGQLPRDWQDPWNEPPAACRPKQIIHGHHFRPSGRNATAETVRKRIRDLQRLGLGGIVCNVPSENYLENEQAWPLLEAGVRACRDLGLIVWIYDEKGYPSGSAGGLVLREDPAYEALELAYDDAREDPFVIRPSYEYTHANNNYHASRRYANLIDPQAVQCFIEVTHERYWKHLRPFFGTTIEATFTDEPSLLAVSLGQIPEPARQRVPIEDPPDPDVQRLPAVPWCGDLAARYRERFQEDLMPVRRSLFVGDRPEDRRVRRQFWSLIADLVADRYLGALGRWCARHQVASSGHTLHEESILHHVPLEGNGLKVLGQMQIPGMDMLSSDPRVVTYSGWLTAALPTSAATLHGRRRCMTEVSDFHQKMSDSGPATLAAMQATAGWQAAWGITDFTLYYRPQDRSSGDLQQYCLFVGRLNAMLQQAAKDAEVLLYYPIHDLWAEYRPIAEKLTLDSQSPRARRIVQSFVHCGRTMQRSQIPFVLVDHEHLGKATLTENGRLRLADQTYRSLVIPDAVTLPPPVRQVIDEFRRAGGNVVTGLSGAGTSPAGDQSERLRPSCRLDPASTEITLGRFRRDGRQVLVLVNAGAKPYDGQLVADRDGRWQQADPASGIVSPLAADAAARAAIHLDPLQTLILVQRAATPSP